MEESPRTESVNEDPVVKTETSEDIELHNVQVTEEGDKICGCGHTIPTELNDFIEGTLQKKLSREFADDKDTRQRFILLWTQRAERMTEDLIKELEASDYRPKKRVREDSWPAAD